MRLNKNSRFLCVPLLAVLLLFSFKSYADQDIKKASADNATIETTAPQTETLPEPPRKVADPLKYFNWGMYYFNDTLNLVIMNPVTVVYSYIIPRFLRTGINNAVNNIVTPISMVNNFFQLKFKRSGTETLRFLSNSTIGLLGLIEVAEPLFGLEPHSEDFGQTFGHYGLHEGFYLNLPLLGQTTLRDLIGILTDSTDAIETHRGKEIGPFRFSKGLTPTSINANSLMLGQYKKAKKVAKEKGIPPYIFLRDAWFKKRYAKIQE